MEILNYYFWFWGELVKKYLKISEMSFTLNFLKLHRLCHCIINHHSSFRFIKYNKINTCNYEAKNVCILVSPTLP